MSTKLADILWQKTKIKIFATIIIPGLIVTGIVFWIFVIEISGKTSLLSQQIALNVEVALSNGGWIAAQNEVNKSLELEVVDYVSILVGDENIYGPVGLKSIFSSCNRTSHGLLEVTVCAPVFNVKSASFFSGIFLLLTFYLFGIVFLIRNILAKENDLQFSKLTQLTSRQFMTDTLPVTDVYEFQKIEEHLKNLARQHSISESKLLRSEGAWRYIHDIRSPLANIKNAIQSSERIVEVIPLIDRMLASADENLNLIAKTKVRLTEVSLNLELIKQIFSSKAIIRIDSDAKNKYWIPLAGEAFLFVIINLIDNSIAASSLNNPVIQIEIRLEGCCCVICFTDNGPGASSSLLHQLNIGKPVSSTKIGGKGVGLSGVHQVINSAKGSIVFSNNDTGGFRAEIRLPTLSEAAQSPSRIFFIEDDKYIRNMWINSAKAAGLSLIASESIELAMSETFQEGGMIFLDLNLRQEVDQEVSLRQLALKGYELIYHASGDGRELEDPTQLSLGNVGKVPPWENL